MYVNFFNLVGEPFNVTPDPAFLFLSPSHKEALGSIVYGVEMRKGFVVITGEVGTGKTTVIRACLEGMNREQLRLAYIFNPHVTFAELLGDIFQELGLREKPGGEDVHSMVRRMQRFLIVEYRAGRNVVLIIDEAQNLPRETLESLRILSNLETTSSKLLQIILVGQPELDENLEAPSLRQLRQRVAVRATMRSLTPSEAVAYIAYRISLVSPEGNRVFTRRAVERIVKEAGGVPRVLNILCDNALIAAFGYQQRPVTRQIVEEVLADYYTRRPKRVAPYRGSKENKAEELMG